MTSWLAADVAGPAAGASNQKSRTKFPRTKFPRTESSLKICRFAIEKKREKNGYMYINVSISLQFVTIWQQ